MSEATNQDASAEDKTTASTPSFMPVPTGHSLPASTLAETVRKNVERAGFPELNESMMTAEAERGVASIRAGTALPLDGTASKGDAYFLDDLSAVKSRVEEARTALAGVEESLFQLRRQLAELPAPLTRRQWWGLVVALAIVMAIGVQTLQALLASSFDELLFRGYFLGLGVPEAESVSREHAERLVLVTAAFMLGGKALAIVGSSGRLTAFFKASLLGIALLFSTAFAVIRLAEGFSFSAIAVSLVELAILASFTALLVAVSAVLKESADRAIAGQALHGAVDAEQAHAEHRRTALALASQEYESRRLALAQREDDCRRLPLYEEAARKTVEAETLVATAALITATVNAAVGQPNTPAPVAAEQGGVS